MRTFLLPLATAVLGIAVGFAGGKAGDGGRDMAGEREPVARSRAAARQDASRGEETGAEAAADRRGQRATALEKEHDLLLSALLKGRSITGISGEELFALLGPEMGRESGWEDGEAERLTYQYRILASRLPLEVTEKVLALAQGKGLRGSFVNILFSGYAQRDMDRAIAWAETQPDAARFRTVAVNRLSLTDPARAKALHQEAILSGGDSLSWDSNHVLAENIAKRGQAEFFEFLDKLPSASQPNLISTSLKNLPKEDVATFMTEVQKRADEGKMDRWWMSQVLDSMAGNHPAELRKWMEGLEPGTKRAEAEVILAGRLSRSGNAGEVDALLRSAVAGSPGREKEFVMSRVRTLVSQDPELAEKLVNLLPEDQKLTREDVKDWGNYSYGRTDTVLEVAKYIHSPDEQAAYLVDSFNKMGNVSGGGRKLNATDFDILSHRLAKMNLSANAMAQAKTALSSARDSTLGVGK